MARLIVTSGVGDIIAPSVHRCSQILDTNQARSQAGALKRESLTCLVPCTDRPSRVHERQES